MTIRMDKKQKIVDSLDILRIRDLQSGEKFSALAYTKAIRELKKLDTITSIENVEGVAGVGKKIKEKIQEILTTGSLEAATTAMKDLKIDVYQDLLQVYGIGPVKAKELIEKDKITSIEDLRKKPELLNEKQIIGLKYYEDMKERIPRKEMDDHNTYIQKFIKEPCEATIVGSYRREAETSGDIDVLIKAPEDFNTQNLVHSMVKSGYIVDILALGSKKCMAFVKLKNGKVRRMDLLISPEKEYPYALLYFTGSDSFNVAFRKYALTKGYTLNEHRLSKTDDESELKGIKTEKQIFRFFGLKYKEPKDRKDESSILP